MSLLACAAALCITPGGIAAATEHRVAGRRIQDAAGARDAEAARGEQELVAVSPPMATDPEPGSRLEGPEAEPQTSPEDVGWLDEEAAPELEPGLYQKLLRAIDDDGEAGHGRALRRHLERVDKALRQQESAETRACWQLLKGIVMVELDLDERAEALFRSLAGSCPIWQGLNNLAVLEATRGDFAAAGASLCRAVERAGPGEWKVPLGNLSSLNSEQNPLLVLAGVADECRRGPVPTAACGAPDRAAKCGLVTPRVKRAAVRRRPDERAAREPAEGGRAVATRAAEIAAAARIARQAEITAAIERWRGGWVARDKERYLSSYVDGYTPDEETSHRAWRSKREKRLAQDTGDIRIEVQPPTISALEDGRVLAAFEQTYLDDAYCDRVAKRLVFVRQGGEWKIQSESAETIFDFDRMRREGLCP